MRCENGGPIADEFGAMFLLGRVLINPILHTAAADVRFAPKATEITATPRSDVMGQQQTHAAQQTQHAGCKITRSRVRIALHLVDGVRQSGHDHHDTGLGGLKNSTSR
jgi:hypothetical protein